VAAGDGHLDPLAVLVLVGDGAGVDVAGDDRHLQHATGLRADWQEGAVGLLPLLAEGRQHDRHDLVVVAEHLEQRLVEAAAPVPIGRALELVVEAEAVEEAAQHRVVVMAEALILAEGIGNLRQRPAEMLRQHLLVRDVVGHLPEPVQVVGKGEQPRRQVGQAAKRLAHHGGPDDLAEGADMRQAGGAVAGLEQHIALLRRRGAIAGEQLARLLEGPGTGL
jgi:hypothetical protein